MTLYKNPDFFIPKWAKKRAEPILKDFESKIERACKGSYEDIYCKDDQPLYYKSNQRLDFMINVYQEIIKRCSLKLSELQNESDRRL